MRGREISRSWPDFGWFLVRFSGPPKIVPNSASQTHLRPLLPHITNIAEDGTVPAVEAANWQAPGLNNYRQNVQPQGEFSAPDVTAAIFPICDNLPYALVARVRNIGQTSTRHRSDSGSVFALISRSPSWIHGASQGGPHWPGAPVVPPVLVSSSGLVVGVGPVLVVEVARRVAGRGRRIDGGGRGRLAGRGGRAGGPRGRLGRRLLTGRWTARGEQGAGEAERAMHRVTVPHGCEGEGHAFRMSSGHSQVSGGSAQPPCSATNASAAASGRLAPKFPLSTLKRCR